MRTITNEQFPSSFEEMRAELGSDKVLLDPATGQRFTWVGAGKTPEAPDAILAYARSENGASSRWRTGACTGLRG